MPEAVAKNPWRRYPPAFAHAIRGDCFAAVAQFEELWRDAPRRLPLTGITLSTLLLDVDQSDQALDIACRAAQLLP
jgi:hypothetical protein